MENRPDGRPIPDGYKIIEGVDPYNGWFYLWKYVPSVPAASIFMALFLIFTVLISWKIWKTKTWYCIIFVVGGLFEVIGYAGRIIAHNNTGKLLPFSIQIVAILLAPVLFAASIYMTLGRLIRTLGAHSAGAALKHALVRPDWLTRVFVAGDVTALLMQGTASGLMIMIDHVQTGSNLVVAGLAFHVMVFGLFWITAGLFHWRVRRDGLFDQPESLASASPAAVGWSRTLGMLYGCSALIMTRSIFRMIEFIMGDGGYLLSVEWPLYVFDSAPMWVVMAIFWWYFPSGLKVPTKKKGAVDNGGPLGSVVEVSAPANEKV